MTAPAITRTALAAVLSASDLDAAHAAARAGLDRLEAEARVDPSDVLSVEDAAEMAGWKPPHVRKMVARLRRGAVKNWIGYKLGGRVYLSRSRFEAYLARYTA